MHFAKTGEKIPEIGSIVLLIPKIVSCSVWAVLFFVALTPARGQGLHAYNKARDDEAKKAQEAYKAINLVTVIETERQNLEAIAQKDLELIDAGNKALHDISISGILLAGNNPETPEDESSLESALFLTCKKRVSSLIGDFGKTEKSEIVQAQANEVADLIEAQDNLNAALINIQANSRRIANYGVVVSGLKVEEQPSDKDYRKALEQFENYREKHENVTRQAFDAAWIDLFSAGRKASQASARLVQNRAGEYGMAIQAFEWKKNEMESSKKDSEGFEKKLKELLENYKAQQEMEKNVGTAQAVEAVNGARQQIINGLDSLEKAGLTGKEKALELQLKEIRLLLELASQDSTEEAINERKEKLKESPSVGAIIASHIGNISTQTKSLSEALNKSDVSALIIRKAILQQELDFTKRQIALDEKILDSLVEKRIAMIQELYLLQRAIKQKYEVKRVFDEMGADEQKKVFGDAKDPFTIKIATLLDKKAPTGIKTPIYEALLNYGGSIRVARLRQSKADYQEVILLHQKALNANESAIQMWNGLIAEPLNQLAIYHASGFKPEEVAQLLVNAAGLGSIAWRLK